MDVLGRHTRRYRSTVYILPPSISKKIEGYRWQSFTPPAAGKSRRFRGLICHRRSHIAELCRREGIAESLYYSWSKEFLPPRRGIATCYLDNYLSWFHLVGFAPSANDRACLAPP